MTDIDINYWDSLVVGKAANATSSMDIVQQHVNELGYKDAADLLAEKPSNARMGAARNNGLKNLNKNVEWGLMAQTGGSFDATGSNEVSRVLHPDRMEAFRQRIALKDVRVGDENIIVKYIKREKDNPENMGIEWQAGMGPVEEIEGPDGEGSPVTHLIQYKGKSWTQAIVAEGKVAPFGEKYTLETHIYRQYHWQVLDTYSSMGKDAARQLMMEAGEKNRWFRMDWFEATVSGVIRQSQVTQDLSKLKDWLDYFLMTGPAEKMCIPVVWKAYVLVPDPIESEYTDQQSAIPPMPGQEPEPNPEEGEGEGEGGTGGAPDGVADSDAIPGMPGREPEGGFAQGKVDRTGHDEDWWTSRD